MHHLTPLPSKSNSSPHAIIPLHLPHTNTNIRPTLPLIILPFPPIHLIQPYLAQPLTSFRHRLTRCRCSWWFRFLAIAVSGAAFRGVGGCGRVDVFAVDVLCFWYECAATVAAACVSLFEAEELDLLVNEVHETHGGCWGRRGGRGGRGGVFEVRLFREWGVAETDWETERSYTAIRLCDRWVVFG